MVRSLLRRMPDVRVIVSPRSPGVAADLAASSRVSIAQSNQDVLDAADTILLCLLAVVAKEVMPALRFRPGHRVLSVMVDYSVEDLLVDCSPCSHVELTIPLPFIETGHCPLPCYPTAQIVEELFGDDNIVTVLTTIEAMQPYIAVSGVISAFMQSVDEVSGWLGGQTKNRVAAEAHVLNLLVGYLQAVTRDGDDRLKEAVSDLSTEGGLNAQYRQALLDAGYYQTMRAELDVLLKRLTK